MAAHPGRSRSREAIGSITPLLAGFAILLLTALAVVIDSSAAYLQRQGLDNVADGAAVFGADAGAQAVQTLGIPEERLPQVRREVTAAVQAYLVTSGAAASYPGIRASAQVAADGQTVRVRVSAPVDLPLRIPGVVGQVTVSAEGAAVVRVRRPGSP